MVTGLIVGGLGLLVALFPVVSVWRVSGHVIDQLPETAAETEDDRHRLAIFDPAFVLATRTYVATATQDVEDALGKAGFQDVRAAGERYLSKDCCGEYDAVWVLVDEGPDGATVAQLTVADADIQLSWPYFLIFGLTGTVIGAVMATAGVRRRAKSLTTSTESTHATTMSG